MKNTLSDKIFFDLGDLNGKYKVYKIRDPCHEITRFDLYYQISSFINSLLLSSLYYVTVYIILLHR